MTVAELIAELQKYDPDLTVITNVWTSDESDTPNETFCGDVSLVVKVDMGLALKGDEII
jgi:hypothetical protein